MRQLVDSKSFVEKLESNVVDWRSRLKAQGRNWSQMLYHYRKRANDRGASACGVRIMNYANRSIAKPIEREKSPIPPPCNQLMTNHHRHISLNANRSGNSCLVNSISTLVFDISISNCVSSVGDSLTTSHNFPNDFEGEEIGDGWTRSGRLNMSAATSSTAAKSALEQPPEQRPRIRIRKEPVEPAGRWTPQHRKLRRCKRCEFAGQNYLLPEVDKQTSTDRLGRSDKKLAKETEKKHHRSIAKIREHVLREKTHCDIATNSLEVDMQLIEGQQRAAEPSKRQSKMLRSLRPKLKLNMICFSAILFLSLSNVFPSNYQLARASLIIGDSAIEIQEVDSQDASATAASNPNNNNNNNNNNINNNNQNAEQTMHQHNQQQPPADQQNQVIFGSTIGESLAGQMSHNHQQVLPQHNTAMMKMPGPLPPLGHEDITDGDKSSRNNHDYDLNELNLNERQAEKNILNHVLSASPKGGQEALEDKTIAGKVVDFELTPAGGHNKAKIKKKKKKMAKQSMFKKWGHKKESEKKMHEKKHKESMKKKKEEGHKGKKKWGKEEHGMKKKGNFKKKKWGKKIKKGKGIKKGKKGKKFLKDVGHKNTGFKTVYHKEEWGKSSKWHDIKRQKKWDEKSKKWKKKWKKEKGKKYKGDHMKKFEKKKKSGKKYKKEKEDKFKKFKKEKFEKGKKKKLEEKAKKKESGAKKQMKEMKKKKKKHSG